MTFMVNGNTVITSDRLIQLPSGTSRPASPKTGQLFFDTSIAKVIVWDGTRWRSSPASIVTFSTNGWGWGGGQTSTEGRIGDGTTYNRSVPVQVSYSITDWVQIAAGGFHSGGIRANGAAYCWGRGSSGQIGDNSNQERRNPRSVLGGAVWSQISCGNSHTAAVRTNGTAWGWGLNSSGRLGDNTITARSSPVQVVGGFTDWTQISAGTVHTCARRNNGTIWCWGGNGSGQLGASRISTASTSSPVQVSGGFTDWTKVSCRQNSVIGLRSNGTAWGWGNNANGQLGTNSTGTVSSPVQVAGGFSDWIDVSMGYFHAAGVRSNGTLWCWGLNGQGRLGDNTITNRLSPVQIVGGITNWSRVSAGGEFTVGLTTNGTIWTWGRNAYGQLGDGTLTSRSSPVLLNGGFTNWTQIYAGNFHAMARRSSTVL